MYFVIVGEDTQVLKAQKNSNTPGDIVISDHYNMNTLDGLNAGGIGPYSFGPIFSMTSLETYGYFISNSNTATNPLIWQISLDMQTEADGTFSKNTYNDYVENTLGNPTWVGLLADPVYNMQNIQGHGEMIMSRPVWQVRGGGAGPDYSTYRNMIRRVTTESTDTNDLIIADPSPNGDIRPLDVYNYPMYVFRNHMFNLLPGNLEDDPTLDAANTDYDRLKVAIIDLRAGDEGIGDEVIRWPLEDCGNGNYNATAFEECDYAGEPPRDTYVYNSAASGTTAAGYWWSTDNNRWQACDDLCFMTEVDLCGDSLNSNPPSEATDLPANGLTLEACDDGNTVSGDGCSGDCQTIEYGWECPTWGNPCRLLCGNGKVDAPYKIGETTDANGVVTDVMFTEVCDHGDDTDTALTYDFADAANNRGRNNNVDAVSVIQYACTAGDYFPAQTSLD